MNRARPAAVFGGDKEFSKEDSTSVSNHQCIVLESSHSLDAGTSTTISFAYGYKYLAPGLAAKDVTGDILAEALAPVLAQSGHHTVRALEADTLQQWARFLPRFDTNYEVGSRQIASATFMSTYHPALFIF